MRPITTEEIIAELKRELGVRRRVYPDWIRGTAFTKPKITQEKADYQVAVLEAAVKKMEALIPKQETIF